MTTEADVRLGPGHVCKEHGIRWPHACGACDGEAWVEHMKAKQKLPPPPDPGGDGD